MNGKWQSGKRWSEFYNTYNVGSDVSPDGNRVAMYSNKDGAMSIYIISLDSGKIINGLTIIALQWFFLNYYKHLSS